MRVLAIGNLYPPHVLGGYEIIWRGAMAHLRELGHEARILTSTYRSARVPADLEQDPDVHRELDWYWREHGWPRLGARARLRLERRNAAVLERHLDEFAPQLVSWWPMGGMSLGLIERCLRRGLPAVFFVEDFWPVYGLRHDAWLRMWRGWGGLTEAVERLTGLPARVRMDVGGRWLFASSCVRQRVEAAGWRIADAGILPPGIERRFLEAAREPVVPSWRWRLLYLGRVVAQKGVHTAVQALSLLPPAATLRIVGEGDPSYREELIELARRLGVGDRVRLEPQQPRERLVALYRDCDAVVFPVEWAEPWGLVPLEAMAVGRPVVASGRGGSGEYLRDGVNALLFCAGDASSLARSLTRLADSPELRERLRAGGHQTAERHGEDAFNRRAVEEMEAALARAGGRGG